MKKVHLLILVGELKEYLDDLLNYTKKCNVLVKCAYFPCPMSRSTFFMMLIKE